MEKEQNEVKAVDDMKEVTVPSLAFELLQEVKKHARRWMIAFFTVLVLWALTIGGFIWFLNQYEYESYTQDGEGYNNINTGEQGDVINGAEIPSNEEKER